jgi:hypothetical protein
LYFFLPIINYKFSSINASIFALESGATILPKTSPFLNIIRVGIVSTPYSSAISAASSISNLAKISLSSC